MRLTLSLTICLMQIFFSSANANEGKYTVIAPGTIHSNDKYTAAVAVHHTSQPCKIKVGITGPSFNETKVVEASQNEVKHVDFELPELEKGDYNLTAEGVDCFDNFKNTTKLNYAKFNNHVRIQTDKGLYKPGDDINYRVIFMDKDLKPAAAEKDAVIWFEDGKRNRIKEIRDFETVKGVYTGKFKISEFPVTGGWRLGVKNGGRFDRTVYFEVDKYVLPKYVVKVEATESVSVKDGDMQIVVRANYTYGKPLDGKATVILSLGSGYYFDNSRNSEVNMEKKQPPIVIKTADMVKGKAKIDLNVKDYEPYLPYKNSPSYMGIVATVEEQFTGVKINGTSSSTLYPYRYAMNCISYDTCSTFEVDKEKDVLFQITYIDSSNLKDTKSVIELIYKEVLRKNHWWHRERELEDDDSVVVTTMEPPVSANHTVTFKGHMNETGFASFKVSLPDLPEYEGYSHYYSLELKYLDEQRELYTTYQHREPKKIETPKEEDDKPKEYFKLLDKYSQDSKLYLNKADQFTLNSSQPLPYFDYNIIGRGNILKSGHVDLADKPKVYNLTLTPELAWAPNFGIYVYYVDEKGEYHYAEQRYHIDFELQNQINVTAAEQVKPGEEVALKIQTEPNSFVGLMAVDQSVLLLRSNNDLNPHEFNWVLGSYSTNTPHQGGYSEYPGTTSGCVTLTNADYFYNWTRPDYLSSELLREALQEEFITTTVVKSGAPMAAAGHVGFSGAANGGGGGGAGVTNVQVRKDFSETWLFANIENTETAEFTWSKKIPETITSWVLTAFSLNPTKGLGVTKDQTKITTFLPFFISIRLPYSVKRGEVINVPALVFNYLDKALDVEVTLDNSDDEYEFTEFSNEVITEQKRSKTVRVPANGAAGVSFLLKPKVIGNVMLKFTAISPVAGDAIHKSMKVVPEGITQYANRAYFVNLKKEPEVKNSFELELPEDLVPDSEHVEVGVMGDILGPVLNNLDNLVRLPTGCGEQTMSTLLPNYLVMKYLKDSERLTPALETKLRYNLDTGYQNMLKYRHNDGSFSSFGPPQMKDKPRNGSTWLTAYVMRSFQQIKQFVDVNDKIIDEGLKYLSQQQAANGSFTEKGDYFYASQKNHVTLTGSAVLALLENATYAEKYSNELKKGLDFMAQNIDKTDSLQAQAMGTYTLNKAKHSAAKEKLSKLKTLAKTENDRMWWSSDKKPIGPRWWFYVFSNDVEITSYALLTMLDQESTKVDDVLPIIKWLIAQRNSYGGFASTQDTVVGLTALIKFAKFADYQPAKMSVDIESKDKKETIKLTEENGILYQNVEMPPKTKSIDFTAKGTGSALVQIAYQYNIFEKDPKPSFTIKTTKLDNNRPTHLEMLVCVNYVGEGESSNMAVFEISTPSGYVIDDESLKEIKQLKRVSNTELKNSDSMLVVYFDHLFKNDETCMTIEAFRTHAVAMQKPAPLVLYDYYDTSKKATAFYEVESKLCDICESEEECSKCK
ncbi:thioester-containing protein 1 allele R1 isoform X2 [Calliphora vicina]|uniref:thioester-containing protein 1 allele R1 isoform X2 n=1 Tax=Calliphora vicina TaxID=7373 RepID=UPI00325B1627